MGRPYFIARAGSAAVAGMTQVERRRPDELVAQWISDPSVSNVDSVVDPQGAPFGLVRLGPKLNPPLGGPSALVGSFLWRDCFTKGVELARTFYSNLAGLAATRQARPDSLVQQHPYAQWAGPRGRAWCRSAASRSSPIGSRTFE